MPAGISGVELLEASDQWPAQVVTHCRSAGDPDQRSAPSQPWHSCKQRLDTPCRTVRFQLVLILLEVGHGSKWKPSRGCSAMQSMLGSMTFEQGFLGIPPAGCCQVSYMCQPCLWARACSGSGRVALFNCPCQANQCSQAAFTTFPSSPSTSLIITTDWSTRCCYENVQG
jgi:hypothetical protein